MSTKFQPYNMHVVPHANSTFVSKWMDNLCEHESLKPFIYDSRSTNHSDFPCMQILCNDVSKWPATINICHGNKNSELIMESLILHYSINNMVMPTEEKKWDDIEHFPVSFFGNERNIKQIKNRIDRNYQILFDENINLVDITCFRPCKPVKKKDMHPAMFEENIDILHRAMRQSYGCYIFDFSDCDSFDTEQLGYYLKDFSNMLFKINSNTKDDYRVLIIGPPYEILYPNEPRVNCMIKTVDQQIKELQDALLYHPSSILAQNAIQRLEQNATKIDEIVSLDN